LRKTILAEAHSETRGEQMRFKKPDAKLFEARKACSRNALRRLSLLISIAMQIETRKVSCSIPSRAAGRGED
jgi:hypothetical protein